MNGGFHTPRAGDRKPNPAGLGAHAAKTIRLPEQVAYELRRGSMRMSRMADWLKVREGRRGCNQLT